MKPQNLSVPESPLDTRGFDEVLRIIQSGCAQAVEAVNLVLMQTYWSIGQHLHRQVADAGWGKGVVKTLADWLQIHAPDAKGFSSQNLWRMKQFYEVFSADEKLSALPRVLSWTHYCTLVGQCKTNEERLFYALSAQRARWSSRELERQISVGAFERTMLADKKLSALPRVLPQAATSVFKDSYLLDFLNLPQPHSEAELQTALLAHLRQFLLELGDGFAFVGEKVRLQVGQLNFYLEALDRDRKRPHENPSIGVLLCASKDDEVVEYALSRSASPALIAQYQTQLPNKAFLQAKLHEFYQLNMASAGGEA